MPASRIASRLIALASGLLILSACDNTPVEPPRSFPHSIHADISPQTGTLGSGQGNEGQVDQMNLSGQSYDTPTLVVITVSGIIARTNSGAWGNDAGKAAAPLDPGGEFVWDALYQCFGNVTVGFTKSDGGSGGYFPFCDTYNQRAPTATWADTATVTGLAWASRLHSYTGGAPPYCYPNCYIYDGSQQVTVQPMPATLRASANKMAVAPGTGVTFTATAVAANGQAAPFDITTWSWQPDSGQSASCPAHTTTSTITAYYTGTLTATGLANGSQQTRTVGILVSKCLTGDSLIDTKAMYDALTAAWNASNAADTNKNNRKEQAGYVYQNSTGQWGYKINFNDPKNDACDSFAGSAGVPDSLVKAFVHVHPFKPYETLPSDSTACPGRAGGLYAPKPSVGDVDFLKSAQQINSSIAGYFMDADNIYWFDASGKKRTYPRKSGSCVRI